MQPLAEPNLRCSPCNGGHCPSRRARVASTRARTAKPRTPRDPRSLRTSPVSASRRTSGAGAHVDFRRPEKLPISRPITVTTSSCPVSSSITAEGVADGSGFRHRRAPRRDPALTRLPRLASASDRGRADRGAAQRDPRHRLGRPQPRRARSARRRRVHRVRRSVVRAQVSGASMGPRGHSGRRW